MKTNIRVNNAAHELSLDSRTTQFIREEILGQL